MAETPLERFTVLDLSQGLAGPTAGALLADAGADVVSIEPPDGGSQRRLAGGGTFPNVSRNKRSVAVDLKAERGRAVLHRLVAAADALLHNNPPGRAADLGCDYETLSDVNPALVYCSITGYGESGPYSDRPGIDSLAQAMSGLMDATGEPDRKPSRIGGGVIDTGTGIAAAFAIVTALHHAARTGEGQKVESALLDTAAAMMSGSYTSYSMTGEAPQRMGHSTAKYAPCGVFETATGPVYVAVPFQYVWERFCRAIDREAWLEDPRFESNQSRKEHREELHALIESAFADYRREELLDRLHDAFITAAEVKPVPDVVEDEHLHGRGTLREVEYDGETVVATGPPVRFHGTPATTESVAPAVGEHTRAVLEANGFDAAEIDDLLAAGAVVQSDG